MTPLAQKALELAISQLGIKEEPPGSNRGPMVDEYIRAAGLDPERGRYPWCAAFVVWCIRRAARELSALSAFSYSARCLRLVELNPTLVIDRPEPGAVFVHLRENGDGHTGFVTEVMPDLSFWDVSGNSDAAGSRTGGSVCKNLRAPGYATAFLAVR